MIYRCPLNYYITIVVSGPLLPIDDCEYYYKHFQSPELLLKGLNYIIGLPKKIIIIVLTTTYVWSLSGCGMQGLK